VIVVVVVLGLTFAFPGGADAWRTLGPLLVGVLLAVGLVGALAAKIDRRATPSVVPTGAMVLQPNEERRRTGSHYTPRSLTEPIVRTALEPVLTATRPVRSNGVDCKVGLLRFEMRAFASIEDLLAWLPAEHTQRTSVAIEHEVLRAALTHISDRCVERPI